MNPYHTSGYIETKEERRVCAPNSIYHGTLIKHHNKETLLNIELNRLLEFVDFLFEKHLDYLVESEVWDEFNDEQLK